MKWFVQIGIAMLALMVLMSAAACAEGATVVATNFPCYDFARQVAGDAAEVKLLIRPGTEVHTYEPTPSDILTIGEAELFVYIGGASDIWVEDILSSLDEEAPTTLRLMESVEALEAEEDHHHHEEAYDEHIWTSPKNALHMVRAVEAALCEVLPESAEAIHANADTYAAHILAIDAELEALMANAVRNEVIFADRFPFLYLANDYGLNYRAAFSSCTSETEPSVRTIIELIFAIEEENIPVIYVIEMSNGLIAKTIAEETGVEVRTLHSAQTVTQKEFEAGVTYVSIMQDNLVALRDGLS